jgi:hypothetical protein
MVCVQAPTIFPLWCLEDSNNVNDVPSFALNCAAPRRFLGNTPISVFFFRNFEFLLQIDTIYQQSSGDNKQEVSNDLRAAPRVNELKIDQELVLDLKFRSVKFKLMKSPLKLESSIAGCKIATFGARTRSPSGGGIV